ncbi:hypothetical protein WMF11_29490 [Sorangium sp. So ce295]
MGVVVDVDDPAQQPAAAPRLREQVRQPFRCERVAPRVPRQQPAWEPRRLARLELPRQLRRRRVRLQHPQATAPLLDLPRERVRPAEAQAAILLGERRAVAALDHERDRAGQREIDDRHRGHTPGDRIDRIARVRAAAAAMRGVGAAAAAARPAAASVLAAAARAVAAVLPITVLAVAAAISAATVSTSAAPAAAEDEDAGVHAGDHHRIRKRSRSRHAGMLGERSADRNPRAAPPRARPRR